MFGKLYSKKSLTIIFSYIAGWFIYSIIYSSAVAIKAQRPPDILPYIYLYGGGISSFGLVLSLISAYLYHLLLKKTRKAVFLIIITFFVSYICTFIWEMFLDIYAVSFNEILWENRYFTLNLHYYNLVTLLNVVIFLGFSAIFYILDYVWELKLQREQTQKAVALANEAQLKMLRYQLNPHFLFNALNSIRAMVIKEPVNARKMITELSEFLRYSLSDSKMENVTIGKEMEAIDNYLDIQKIRFGENLKIHKNIDDNARTFKIPCFLIHPLVENAIKYGVQTSPKPLEINIKAEQINGNLAIEVFNTGKLVENNSGSNHNNGTSTGLSNIRQRLEHIFPGKYNFQIYEKENRVFTRIEIKS